MSLFYCHKKNYLSSHISDGIYGVLQLETYDIYYNTLAFFNKITRFDLKVVETA